MPTTFPGWRGCTSRKRKARPASARAPAPSRASRWPAAVKKSSGCTGSKGAKAARFRR